MIKLLLYYFLIFNIFWVSLIIPLYSSPGAVILTLILLVSLVAVFLFNIGIVFLSVMFIIIYVGAVIILYIYSLSMLRERLQGFNTKNFFSIPLIFFFILFIFFLQVLIDESFGNLNFFINDFNSFGLNSGVIFQDYIFYFLLFGRFNDIKIIGILLYTKFLVLFLACGILLLISLVGSIAVLTRIKND